MHQSSPLEIEAYQLMCAGRFADALPLATRAVAGQRVCLPTHGMLATILLQLGRRHEAEAVISQALECKEGPADAYDALAHVSMQLGCHERSNVLYRRAVKLAPADPRFWHNLASSERSLGRLREAEAACDRTIALDRTRYASYLLRSELRLQSSDDNHILQLLSELSRHGLDDSARMFLGYALAKELDDLKRFDEAFQHLAEASTIRRRHLAYDVSVDQRKFRRIEEVFPRELVFPKEPLCSDAAASGTPTDTRSSRHVFIVGLPRSGTTLLEHMLLGLTGVRSNGETDNFARALMAAAVQDRADIFAGAAAADPAVVAAKYDRSAGGDPDRGSNSDSRSDSEGSSRGDSGVDTENDRIIEKLPMNYLYLGAIRRALPSSRLILVNRHPVDGCFAMYRTLFGEAYPFSYDFEDLARYYAAYEQLMNHWRACFGTTLCEVAYEDLVDNPAQVGARVAEYCGLEWNDQAVDIHARAGVSLTASAAQIRRPIYRTSCGRWRYYERHLEPLIQALRRLQVSIPEADGSLSI